MTSLFNPEAHSRLVVRLARLEAGATRGWGKMDPAQMLAHCSIALEVATGEQPRRQKLLGKLLAPFFRAKLLGEEPFSRNSPTDPTFVVADARDFAAEKARLRRLVDTFAKGGPEPAARQVHSFLGRLTGEEWGVMMWKHLDHHLRQFGA